MRKFIGVLSACAAFWAGLTFPRPAGEEEGVIRSESRAVYVDVTVTDGRGNPVTGLSEDDFSVWEEGVRQPVLAFQPPRPSPTAPPAAAAGAGGDPAAAPPAAAPADGRPASRTVLLLDSASMSWWNRGYTVEQVRRFLRERPPGEAVEVYVLGQDLVRVEDFGSAEGRMQAMSGATAWISTLQRDDEALKDSVEGAGFGSFRTLSEAEQRQRKAMAGSFADEEEYFRHQRRDRTLHALSNLSHHLAGQPGRKNVVWLTAGFPLAENDRRFLRDLTGEPLWRSTVADLQGTDVALHPVDVRGAWAPLDDSVTDCLDRLAQLTGGQSYCHGNDFRGALRRVEEAAGGSYLIAFAPNPARWDGAFHPIEVKVRPDGLTVRHRPGYLAYRSDDESETERVRIMAWEGCADLEATGLSVSAAVAGLPPGDGKERPLALRLVLDPSELDFQPAAASPSAALDLLVMSFSPSGQPLAAAPQEVVVQPIGNRRNGGRPARAAFERTFAVPAGAVRVKVVVRDRRTGRMGSVGLPLPASGGDPAARGREGAGPPP